MYNFFAFIALFFVQAQPDWKLNTEKDGIRIYTATIANSKVKAVKADCTFNATPSQLVAVLLDIKQCGEWVYHTKSCRLVKQVSPSELYYYSEVNVPWPVEDRDFVVHVSVSQNPESKVVTVEAPVVPGFVPAKKEVVRINESKGKWVIIPISANEVKVEYSLQVDPGGSVPTWLTNLFAAEGPLQSFKSLKKQLQKPQYKNANYSFIAN